MLGVNTIYFVAATLYFVSAVVVAGWSQRLSRSPTGYHYALVFALVLAGLTVVGRSNGIGMWVLEGETVDSLLLVSDLYSYTLFFVLIARTANVSRWLLLVVVATTPIQRLAVVIIPIFDGLVGLVATVVGFGGYLFTLYLTFGPIQRSSRTMPNATQLLYTKVSTYFVFLIGALILSSVLEVSGLLDGFVYAFIIEYLDYTLRVGFVLLFLANADDVPWI